MNSFNNYEPLKILQDERDMMELGNFGDRQHERQNQEQVDDDLLEQRRDLAEENCCIQVPIEQDDCGLIWGVANTSEISNMIEA